MTGYKKLDVGREAISGAATRRTTTTKNSSKAIEQLGQKLP